MDFWWACLPVCFHALKLYRYILHEHSVLWWSHLPIFSCSGSWFGRTIGFLHQAKQDVHYQRFVVYGIKWCMSFLSRRLVLVERSSPGDGARSIVSMRLWKETCSVTQHRRLWKRSQCIQGNPVEDVMVIWSRDLWRRISTPCWSSSTNPALQSIIADYIWFILINEFVHLFSQKCVIAWHQWWQNLRRGQECYDYPFLFFL